jgi:hypothetical protein
MTSYFINYILLNFHLKKQKKFPHLRREPWASGKGRGLMIKRSWVRTPAQYTGWM